MFKTLKVYVKARFSYIA